MCHFTEIPVTCYILTCSVSAPHAHCCILGATIPSLTNSRTFAALALALMIGTAAVKVSAGMKSHRRPVFTSAKTCSKADT